MVDTIWYSYSKGASCASCSSGRRDRARVFRTSNVDGTVIINQAYMREGYFYRLR